MPFRISDANIFNDALRSLKLNRFRLSQVQTQISSGRRINSVAEDPGNASHILSLRRTAAQLEQFGRNLNAAEASLSNTDASLDTLTGVFTRLRELAVSADVEEDQFANINSEVEQLFDEVLRLANTRLGDRFLYGGLVTDAGPYVKGGDFVDGVTGPNPTITQANPQSGEGAIQVQIGGASRIQINVEGAELFLGDTDGDGVADGSRVNLFDVVREFRNRLEDPTTGNPADMTGQLDQALNQILQIRGDVGGRLNRIHVTQEQYAALKVSLELERSSLEDLDIAEAATELAQAENVYQAALAVTARVIQPTLLHFLS
jgi:flagellar hook-associated protein 3 FlgL